MKHREYMNSKTTKESATNKFLNAEPPKIVPNKAKKQNGSQKSKANNKNIPTNFIPTKTSKREPADKDNDNPLNLLPDKQAKAAIWNKNTILVVGDSTINNIDERKLGRRYPVKVRSFCSFSGATTADLEDYLKALLSKKPAKIILVVGTNDIQLRPVADILKNVKRLTE